jgi:hypothetical protein
MRTTFKLTFFLLILVLLSSFVRKLTPLSFLNNKQTLILKQGIIEQFTDTLNSKEVNDLSNLEFEEKNFKVENFGVTPDNAVSIYEENERICLLSIWNISDVKYAININYLKESKFFYGYVIAKEKLNNKITFKEYLQQQK